jgi:hypothetical protein
MPIEKKVTREVSKKKEERTILHKLTQEELAAKGSEAGKLRAEISERTEKLKQISDSHKGQIAEVTERFNGVLKVLEKGEEERKVDCVKVLDFARNTVEYHFPKEGTKVDERAMNPTERQVEIFGEGKNGKRKTPNAAPLNADPAAPKNNVKPIKDFKSAAANDDQPGATQ